MYLTQEKRNLLEKRLTDINNLIDTAGKEWFPKKTNDSMISEVDELKDERESIIAELQYDDYIKEKCINEMEI